MTEKKDQGRKYTFLTLERAFWAYNGEGKDQHVSARAIKARKLFTDKVMKKINEEIPLEVIEGGLSGSDVDVSQAPDIETAVKFYGPKRPAQIVPIEDRVKTKSPQGSRFESVISFFKK